MGEVRQADRKLAEKRSQYFEKMSEINIEQMLSQGKWINATLLALNGPALFAIISSKRELDHIFAISLLFIAGLVLALLSGTILHHAYSDLSQSMQKNWMYWSKLSVYGWRKRRFESLQRQKINKIYKYAIFSPICGWLSGICFIIGVILIAMTFR